MLVLCLFVPVFAQAYTGVTIVLSAPTQANLEFVDQFDASDLDNFMSVAWVEACGFYVETDFAHDYSPSKTTVFG